MSCWSGGLTKFNRCQQDYLKAHWIDAACIGKSGAKVCLSGFCRPLLIKAYGRGSIQKCQVNKFGFPRSKPKFAKRIFGFQTGDILKVDQPKGKKAGQYMGRVTIRTSGHFTIRPTLSCSDLVGASHKLCTFIQRVEGYFYYGA